LKGPFCPGLGVGEYVDLDDLRADDGEAHDREWLALREDDDSNRPIDPNGYAVKRKPGEGGGARNDSVRSTNQHRCAGALRSGVTAQHNLRVEHGDQAA
jgi:hypothetical protein